VRAEAQTVAVALRDDVGKTEAVVAARYHPPGRRRPGAALRPGRGRLPSCRDGNPAT